jgi:hypothetical protein
MPLFHSRLTFFIALLAVGVVLLGAAPGARGDVLVNQPYDGFSPQAPSQIFTDTSPVNYNQLWSIKAFDDFTIAPNTVWHIDSVTVFGQDQGDPGQNVSVSLQFASSPNFNNGAPELSGSEDSSGNLNFNSLGVTLGPGTYWLTAYVTRPLLPTGGQWFWDETNAGNPNGSEFYLHNPGGQLLQILNSAGNLTAFTDPTPGSAVYFPQGPNDLAFIINGSSQLIPEPTALTQALIATMIGAGGVYGRRRFRGSSRAAVLTPSK